MKDSAINFDFGANVPEPIRDVEPICRGRVICANCRKIYGLCGEVEQELSQEKTKMLPAANSGNAPQQSGARPTQQRKPNGLLYIKSENLTTDKVRAKILDIRVAEPAAEGTRNFSDIRLKIVVKGATWLYGLKLNNPELAKLQAAFGLDENNYPGKEFFLYNEEDEFDHKIYMRVEPIMEAKSEKKKGARRGYDNEASR